MRFKHVLFLSTACLITSCGVLGSKDKPTSTSTVTIGNGCLDNTSGLLSQYIAGTMTQDNWKSSFSCINDSLNFFTEYVSGSSGDGYTQSDMYTLVSHFLITKNPVSQNLMNAAFNLKAALFGGDSTDFTKDEVALLQSSLTQLQNITADLIPYLQVRQNPSPSYADLLTMVTAFQTAGDQLSDFINTLPVGFMSSQAMGTLISELTTTLSLQNNPQLNDEIFLIKWLMFNTRPDAMEPADWAQIFKTAMGASGILLAYQTAIGSDPNAPQAQVMTRLQNDYQFREFLWQLALDGKGYLENSLTTHDGLTPFPLFDHLVDTLPTTSFGGADPEVVKQALRPLFRKVLASSTQMGFDQGMIDTIYNLIGTWVANTGSLDRFYAATAIDWDSVTPAAMKTAMSQYAGTLGGTDLTTFNSIKTSILNYQPMLYKSTGYRMYDEGVGYSHYQNFVTLTAQPLVHLIFQAYGTTSPTYVTGPQLDVLFSANEFGTLLGQLKLVDPTQSNFGSKRVQDIDLFTPVSDGNQQASELEVVNYLMMVLSSGQLGDKMRTEITPICDVGLGPDAMGWTQLPASCFRLQFNDRFAYWLDYFPHLKAFWATLDAADQAQALIWLEHGARENGYDQEPFGKYDIQAMATILHYTESMFMRFDVNNDDILSKSEVGNAYPVFKALLSQKANQTSDYIVDGIFTYIVRYREMPLTTSVDDIAKLGWWLAIYDLPTTTYSANRAGVFNIVCQLATPVTTTQAALTPTICAP
jgi:hypothetical protein